MNSKSITDQRVISVIENLEHCASNLKWTDVRGAQDLLTAADGLRELQERRRAAMGSEPAHEATSWQVEEAIANMESENDMVVVPRGLLGAASGAIRHPRHEAGVVLGALRHYCFRREPAQPAPVAEREPIAWLNDAYLARGVVDGEAGSEDAGPGYIPVYREAGPQPVSVVQCPFPCGWDNLNKLAIQDAAFVTLALVAGEPATESIRQAAISNNDRLLKVIAACRAAMLQAGNSPLWVGVDWAKGCEPGNSPVIPEGYVMVPKEPTMDMRIAGIESASAAMSVAGECPAVHCYHAMLEAAPQEVNHG